ncbi:hypothetical protein D3C71_1741090 [compost metagenome]
MKNAAVLVDAHADSAFPDKYKFNVVMPMGPEVQIRQIHGVEGEGGAIQTILMVRFHGNLLILRKMDGLPAPRKDASGQVFFNNSK